MLQQESRCLTFLTAPKPSYRKTKQITLSYDRKAPIGETCQIWASRCTAKQKPASFVIELIKIGQAVETRH